MIDFLPTLNALLNATSATFLAFGYRMIRRGNPAAHRTCMLGAVTASCLFLVSYVTYHVVFSRGVTRFAGEGLVRGFYMAILLSHTTLAIVIVPLVIMALYRAKRGRFEAHKKVARWAFPMWLYVSITGVIVYLMLYHLFPSR
jgi:putative membrane protein